MSTDRMSFEHPSVLLFCLIVTFIHEKNGLLSTNALGFHMQIKSYLIFNQNIRITFNILKWLTMDSVSHFKTWYFDYLKNDVEAVCVKASDHYF